MPKSKVIKKIKKIFCCCEKQYW